MTMGSREVEGFHSMGTGSLILELSEGSLSKMVES